MNKKVIIAISSIVILIVICLVGNALIAKIIESEITAATGARAHVGGLSLNIFDQSVTITNFKLYNPSGFPKEVFVDIPLVSVACELSELFSGKVHIKELTLDLKEVTLVKDKEGKRNVENLKFNASGKKTSPSTKPEHVQFDLVNLAIGQVITKDYSVQGPPAITALDINIKKSYKNISSVQQLAAIIIAEPLKAAGIKGLTAYGASVLTGVAILPVAAAFVLTGKDYVRETANVSIDKAYDLSISTLKEMGSIQNGDRTTGVISAEVHNAHVTLKLKKISARTTEITISARKLMMPQPNIASGVMHQILQKIR